MARLTSASGWCWTLAATFTVGMNLTSHASAGFIFMVDATRHVVAAATDAGPPATESHVSMAAGLFDEDAFADGLSLAGSIHAAALQGSMTPDLVGLVMEGGGDASASADATGIGGFSVLADSFFDVFFKVDETGLYPFDASVLWEGDHPPFGGFAIVELVNFDDSLTVHSISTGPFSAPGPVSFSGFAPLAKDVLYRMHAQAKVDGGFGSPGLYSAGAHWDFRLVGAAVPEPAAMSLLVLGATGLLIGRKRWARPRITSR